jgi:hypothetical protein
MGNYAPAQLNFCAETNYMKKIFYFSAGLLFLSLIFLVAYNFAFKNNVNDPSANSKKAEVFTKENPITDDVTSSTSIVNPINESILGAAISEDGNIYYYSIDNQALKKASPEGKDKSILLSNLPGTALRVIWSPKKDKALILIKQTSGEPLWHFANLTTKTLIPLKPEMSRLAWDNLGNQIFYQYTNPQSGERTLNVSNPDGTDWKNLTALKRDTFISAIPRSVSVSFWSKPSALEKTYLESVGLTGENRRLILSEKFGADYLWSPNGEKVLVSVSEEKGGHNILLNVMNQSGGELQTLSIPTFVSKTVWSQDNKTIYYALPGSLPKDAMLPDDYFSKPLSTKDTFWKIDTSTGKQARLVDLKEITQNMDSADLFLTPNEDALFFTDRTTHKLYRIDL